MDPGDARVVLQRAAAPGTGQPHLAAVGFEVADPAAARRAASRRAVRSTAVPRRRAGARAVAAPDGTEIFWAGAGDGTPIWAAEFDEGREPPGDSLISHIDHVNLSQPWHRFDEAVLFYGSVLGLQSQATATSRVRSGWSAAR